MQNTTPYQITTFRDFVPHKLRFIILLFTAIAFQFSGGIYLASVSQMVGGKVLLQEDIMMAGYMSFIGMTMIFPMLFRIKFRFKPRNTLMAVAAGIIICNVINMYTKNLIILFITSFITGILRMIGSFDCFSTLQLKITPKRNMTIFFCVVYLIVTSSIQLSGITTVYMDYFFNWQYMHILVVGLLTIVLICSLLLMKDIRLTKKLPLYGIDTAGAILWTIFLISTAFVFQYGRYLDWFDSVYIKTGTVISIATLLLSIRQMITARRPYISPALFRYDNFNAGLVLALALMLLLSTSNNIENTFIYSIMHYDSLNAISLNWLVFAGIIIGIILSWYTLVLRKMPYKAIIFIGFISLAAYQMLFYFTIDPHINIAKLYPLSIFRGIGYAMLYVSLLLYATEKVPFPHFFQAICVLGFIRTGFGSVMASSLLNNWMPYLVKKNNMLIGWQIDAVNPLAKTIPIENLYNEVNRQATLISMKEILGWYTIIGLCILLYILTLKYYRPAWRMLPKIKDFRNRKA